MGMQENTRKKYKARLLPYNEIGEKRAYNEQFMLAYRQLLRIAQNQLAHRPAYGRLSKTDLVHEAYLKLFDKPHSEWRNRAHFYSSAATAMNHILVDHSRRENAQKRGGHQTDISLENVSFSNESCPEQLIDLYECLDRLARLDKRMYEIVDLRFYGGLTIREIARLLHVSTSTVDRDWAKARRWLYRQLV